MMPVAVSKPAHLSPPIPFGVRTRTTVGSLSTGQGLALSLSLFLVACGAPEATPTPGPLGPEARTRDIETTRLKLDVSALTGQATIQVKASTEDVGLSLETQGLGIQSVTLEDGSALTWRQDGTSGWLDIDLPTDQTTVVVKYTFEQKGFTFDGYMTDGDSFLWPNFCGNLYPCHSDPDDGLRFGVEVTGLPEGSLAVAPKDLIALPAPAYQLGLTVGQFTRHDLGATSDGTRVVFYSQPTDLPADVAAGTGHFRDYVDVFEQYFGTYPFGPEVGAKSAIWCDGGGCAYAGMEEHPYFDVSDGSVNDPTVFTHETSHAWFGDGVRLECWGEDLVMSEGTASYLEIAILGLVDGPEAAQADVQYYQDWLAESIDAGEDAVVWPDSCDEVDTYSIWYAVTYSRGALFWMDVEAQVGQIPLLQALAVFANAHLGSTGTLQDLLDTVAEETGFDPSPLAYTWLKSTDIPPGFEAKLQAARTRNARVPFHPRPGPHGFAPASARAH